MATHLTKTVSMTMSNCPAPIEILILTLSGL